MLIAIEGVDGVGKTTAANNIARVLHAKFVSKPLHELMGNQGMELYRQISRSVNETGNAATRAWFYSFGNVYLSQLASEQHIVTERYLLSNYAWNFNMENQILFEYLQKNCRIPDLTVLLTASRETLIHRICTRAPDDPDLAKVSNNIRRQDVMIKKLQEWDCPAFIVDTDKRNEEAVCSTILEELRRRGIHIPNP